MIMKRIRASFSKEFRENHRMIYYKPVLMETLKILKNQN